MALWTVLTVLGPPLHDFFTVRGWFTDIAHAMGNFAHDPHVRERGRAAASAFGNYAAAHLARLRREPEGEPMSFAESILTEDLEPLRQRLLFHPLCTGIEKGTLPRETLVLAR